MKEITAIIQARVNSRRLPRKVLLPLGGKTVLEQVVERARRSKYIHEVIVATTDNPSDDEIAALCEKKHITYFRGEEQDVLARTYEAAKTHHVKHICRITADCPLIDPRYISLVAKKYASGQYDYVAINRPLQDAKYPDGVDTEIFSFEVLKVAWRKAKSSAEREHVTPYIWMHPREFRIYSFSSPEDLSAYRLTLDEPVDYEVIKEIYKRVKPCTTSNVIRWMKRHPRVRQQNTHIVRDEGYYTSLSTY